MTSLAKTVRCEWGVPLGWARIYPAWPEALRTWLADCRALGLTVITVRPERHGVALIATLPGDPVGPHEPI